MGVGVDFRPCREGAKFVVPLSSCSLALKSSLKSHQMTTLFEMVKFSLKWWCFHSNPFFEPKELSFNDDLRARAVSSPLADLSFRLPVLFYNDSCSSAIISHHLDNLFEIELELNSLDWYVNELEHELEDMKPTQENKSEMKKEPDITCLGLFFAFFHLKCTETF